MVDADISGKGLCHATRRQVLQAAGGAAVSAAFGNSTLLHAAQSAPAPAPSMPDPSPADLINDVAILRQALALHPGLYRYNSVAGMAARLDGLAQDLAATRSMDERYLALARFTATIRCGHSYANFYNQKRAVAAALFDRPTRLPFHFRWIGGRMIVTGHGGDALPPGTEILRINGVSPGAMLKRLIPYVRADGGNDAKRVSLLEVQGRDTIETFDVFHGLIWGRPASGEHRIEARHANGRRITATVSPINLAARRAQTPGTNAAANAPIWEWTIRPDGIAVLRMDNWAMYNRSWDWEAWLTARLDSLKGARALIIDIRRNEGGNDCGNMILARFISQRLARPGAERRVRFRTTPPAIDRYLDTWDNSFRSLGKDAVEIGGGFFRMPPIDGIDTLDPVGPRLAMPLVVLTSPVNSSATYQFAALAKLAKSAGANVTLIGETTGGNQRGINGGAYFFVRLPGCGIECDLPLIGYFPPGLPPDAGVVPDIIVQETAQDIAAGRDRTMTVAVNHIIRG